jgi:hypothetical protein
VQELLGILVLVAIVAVLLRWFGSRRPRRGRRFKCHDCRHLRRGFDDGVLCGYGTREVFKTPANIRMCGDWEAAPGRR